MAYGILGFLIIALIDLPPLLRKKQRRELMVFCIFYIAVFFLALLYAADVKLPSPAMAIHDFMKNVVRIYYPDK